MTWRLLPLLIAFVLVGCGGGDQTASIPSGDEKVAPSASIPDEPEPKPGKPTEETENLATKIAVTVKKKPKIPKQPGAPPNELVIHDIVEGSGPAAKAGDAIEVDYAGSTWRKGEEFDASWGKQVFPLTLGAGGVIDGWELGIPGMKKGGRRMLVIPPDLAYGEQGSPPKIGPNETLVFVIDMRKLG